LGPRLTRLADHSLERFPDGMEDRFEVLDDAGPIDLEGVLDPEMETRAHNLNVLVAGWIERLALTGHGRHGLFMPDHTYVGLHESEVIDDVEAEKHEVGYFADTKGDVHFTLRPTITLYSWRTTQQDFGVLWSCVGFRCEPISEERAEAVYQLVIASATRDMA